MQPIVKFGLTKDGISITLHPLVRYGRSSLGVIVLFYSFMIQRSGQIAFPIKHYWKLTPSIPLLCSNLSTLKLEVGRGGHIFKNNYHQTQKWLQCESYIRKVWKLMSTNNIHIYHLDTYVLTQHTYDACLIFNKTLSVNP